VETGENQNLGLGLTIESEITMDEINMDSIPNLASSCMLVTYTCGTWAGKVSDKRVTADAQQQAGAQHGSGKYVKDLLGNSEALKAVKACGGDARNNIHYPMTQPFQDRGPRLLTNMNYQGVGGNDGYHTLMTGKQNEFFKLRDAFTLVYDQDRYDAQHILGSMFDAGNYPTVEEVEAQFHFGFEYDFLPDSGTMIQDIESETMLAIQDQIKKRDAQRVLAAEANLLKRLEDAMQVLTKQIDWGDNEKAVRIYEKGVQDVLHFTDMLSTGVTVNPVLNDIRDHLDESLRGVSADSLKKDAHQRAETKRNLADAIAALPSFN
jgi:hypothetical protein